MKPYTYEGSELELFAKAMRWKAYWSGQIRPWLKGDVLEVGAGSGNNTQLLQRENFRHWSCLDPDQQLLAQIPAKLESSERHELVAGTIACLPSKRCFDSILYLDVLEHIKNDRGEMMLAASRLNPGGAMVILAPAHDWLYTPFDKAIGHFRRYTKTGLRRTAPRELREVCVRYLDAAGITASLANRFFLGQSTPTEKQILTWDRLLVPVSIRLDRWLRYSVGKSVLGVWIRT
jgi:SAM-dependent methyltransferase